ncbi:MAG: hypothetical protein V4812_02335 [Pseudomonadota bacterium]
MFDQPLGHRPIAKTALQQPFFPRWFTAGGGWWGALFPERQQADKHQGQDDQGNSQAIHAYPKQGGNLIA